jgi:hypoxanthine phosphoribosyltransferase
MGSSMVPPFRLLWSSVQVQSAIQLVAKVIHQSYAPHESVNLVPVLTGGMLFGTSLAMELERLAPGKWRLAPIFASSYSGDGMVGAPVIEIPQKFNESVDFQAPVIIIDDLLDTGTTMNALVHRMKQRGFPQVAVCVLVDKPYKRKSDLTPDFRALVSPSNAWLVGYGMDTQMYYRALDAIYAMDLPPSKGGTGGDDKG